MAVADLPDLKGIHFTPIQQRMMDLLSDGELHTRAELLECLGDDLAEGKAIHMHVTMIRAKIRPLSYAIMIQFRDRVPQYALVRKIKKPLEDLA